jgi:predicted membrane chloride channel (bestrophin family)
MHSQVREVSQTVVTSLVFDRMVEQPAIARAGAARVAKYLAAWAWELNSKLTGPVGTSDTEVLMALLPAEEAVWIASQRSRPLQCLGALRRELHAQWQAGNLPTHLHWKLEEDVRELDLIVGA